MTTAIEGVLQRVEGQPTVAAYAEAARAVRSLGEQLRPVRLSLLATFTIEPLVPYLEVEAARYGFAPAVHVGPFNMVRQQLLSPDSGCLGHRPDVVIVAQLLGDVCPPLANDFLTLSEAEVAQHLEQILAETLATLKTFRQHSAAAVVLHNFTLPPYPSLGIFEPLASESQTEAVRRLNRRLAEAVAALPGVYVLDFDRLCADLGYRNWHDDKMWYLGAAPLAAVCLPALARLQATFVQAIQGGPRKCLVLDLDNTLWGGVLGEDGSAGIKLGHTYPGNVFRDFQRVLLQLHRRGVLLAINSKNNAAEVEEVFRSHPDMVLKLEHFASRRINWRPKPDNMAEIADELNIGLDSLVFMDDSAVECALMRQALPQVLTVQAPASPLKYVQTVMETRAFDRLSFTQEDRRRGTLYQEQAGRRQLERSVGSLQDFLISLRMTVQIRQVDSFTLPRVVDLLQKTNQFNLTTRRYSAAQLNEIMAEAGCGVFTLGVVDRFGDNGTVGAAIVRVQDGVARLDSFLLSCRVIGRTVETAFLCRLVDWAKERGARLLEGEFLPTAKNAPAAGFYAEHGFTATSTQGNGSRWHLQLDNVPFHWPSYIRRADTEETPA